MSVQNPVLDPQLPGVPRSFSLSARLNRIPIVTRVQRGWIVLLGALLVFDMLDLNAFAYSAPVVKEQWALTVGQVGIITAAGFLGQFVGSLAGGRIADRFGRKRTIVAGVLFYSVASLACAFSSGPIPLTILRFLVGAGLQAVTVVLLTYVSEMFPRQSRGRVQALITGASLIGIPAIAWFARGVIPLSADGWRWLFVLGAAGLIPGLLAIRFLPESARWLENRGRADRGEAVVERVEREAVARTGTPLPQPIDEPEFERLTSRDLFRAPYARRTIVLTIFMITALPGFYGFSAWVPTLLVQNGLTTNQSLVYTSILSLAAVPGALAAFLFSDRFERRRSMLVIYSVIALLLLVFGFVGGAPSVLTSGFLISMLLQTGTSVIYAYIPEIFPTQLRGLGAGFTNGVGRLATFGTTFLLAAILSGIGYGAVFVFLTVVVAIAAIAIGLFGENTRNRTLESIAGEQRPTS